MIMEKKNLKTVIFVLTFIISCFIIVSCKDFNACSCTTDNENRELPKDTCTIDTLESGVLCKSVGGYTVIHYSYVFILLYFIMIIANLIEIIVTL